MTILGSGSEVPTLSFYVQKTVIKKLKKVVTLLHENLFLFISSSLNVCSSLIVKNFFVKQLIAILPLMCCCW